MTGNRDEVLTLTRIDTTGNPGGGRVMRLEMAEMGRDWPTYSVSVGGTANRRVENGDNLLIEIWARVLWTEEETAEGRMRMQIKASQYSNASRPIDLVVTFRQQWK